MRPKPPPNGLEPAAGIALFVIGGVCLLAYAVAASAMSTIFLTAIYQYAAFDRVPHGFESTTMAHAFAAKVKK